MPASPPLTRTRTGVLEYRDNLQNSDNHTLLRPLPVYSWSVSTLRNTSIKWRNYIMIMWFNCACRLSTLSRHGDRTRRAWDSLSSSSRLQKNNTRWLSIALRSVVLVNLSFFFFENVDFPVAIYDSFSFPFSTHFNNFSCKQTIMKSKMSKMTRKMLQLDEGKALFMTECQQRIKLSCTKHHSRYLCSRPK